MTAPVQDGPSLTESEIEAQLQGLGFTVVAPMVDHLKTLNGANVRHYHVSFGTETLPMEKILGLGYMLGDLATWVATLDERAPSGWIPLATERGGGVLMVTNSGEVRFWDPDVEATIPAFDSIQAFLDALTYTAPPAPSGTDYVGATLAELATLVATSDANAKLAGMAGRADFVSDLLANHSTRVVPFLMGASVAGQAATVQTLMDESVDPDSTDSKGRTALMLAARFHQQGVIEVLLASGADPTIETADGTTAADEPRISAFNERLEQAIEDWQP